MMNTKQLRQAFKIIREKQNSSALVGEMILVTLKAVFVVAVMVLTIFLIQP